MCEECILLNLECSFAVNLQSVHEGEKMLLRVL
jgi:hypothetical protein